VELFVNVWSWNYSSFTFGSPKLRFDFFKELFTSFSQDSDVTNVVKKLLSLSDTEDKYEILKFLLEWIILGMLYFNINLKFILVDPSRKLLLAKTEIIPHLFEYSRTSEIHHFRCISCLILISIGYFNTSESDSTKHEIDELLLKSLTEMTKVFIF
jgi:hypothetical protein